MRLVRPRFTAYTDGTGRSAGPGGWGLVLIDRHGRKTEHCGYLLETTSQRSELWAAIHALSLVPDDSIVHVISDSQYLVNGMTKWIFSWLHNGWKDRYGAPVKNQDLWKMLYDVRCTQHQVTFEWVRGHNGNPDNERADALAQIGLDNGQKDRSS